MRTLDDSTTLNSAEIDVAVRIGWIIRMARTTPRDSADTRLQVMATRLGSSPAHLSRVETGQRRDSTIVHRYEESLGLPTGALWAPIAIMCRTFPQLSPRDTGEVATPTDVRQFSHLTQILQDPDTTPDGADWLMWTRVLGLPENISMPIPTFRAITRRLMQELATVSGHQHPVRFEAMSILRCSAYGDLVLDLVRDAFESGESSPRALNDLAWLTGQNATPEGAKWALSLLENEELAVYGALTLEAMGQVSHDFWKDLTLPLLGTFDRSAPGSNVEKWTTHLIRLVPRDVWALTGDVPSRPLPAVGTISDWTRDVANPLWEWCVSEADSATSAAGLTSQPLLARLIFELVFSPWETRAASAAVLLSTMPAVAQPIPYSIARYAEQHPDSPLRRRMLRRLTLLLRDAPLAGFDGWERSDDPLLRATASAITRNALAA